MSATAHYLADDSGLPAPLNIQALGAKTIWPGLAGVSDTRVSMSFTRFGIGHCSTWNRSLSVGPLVPGTSIVLAGHSDWVLSAHSAALRDARRLQLSAGTAMLSTSTDILGFAQGLRRRAATVDSEKSTTSSSHLSRRVRMYVGSLLRPRWRMRSPSSSSVHRPRQPRPATDLVAGPIGSREAGAGPPMYSRTPSICGTSPPIDARARTNKQGGRGAVAVRARAEHTKVVVGIGVLWSLAAHEKEQCRHPMVQSHVRELRAQRENSRGSKVNLISGPVAPLDDRIRTGPIASCGSPYGPCARNDTELSKGCLLVWAWAALVISIGWRRTVWMRRHDSRPVRDVLRLRTFDRSTFVYAVYAIASMRQRFRTSVPFVRPFRRCLHSSPACHEHMAIGVQVAPKGNSQFIANPSDDPSRNSWRATAEQLSIHLDSLSLPLKADEISDHSQGVVGRNYYVAWFKSHGPFSRAATPQFVHSTYSESPGCAQTKRVAVTAKLKFSAKNAVTLGLGIWYGIRRDVHAAGSVAGGPPSGIVVLAVLVLLFTQFLREPSR
ncbi:uncharacterized protein B0H18DRAFT_954333 [Fomitopsis serialis]|uniref:uncharacterized protein n=1 Tax=Fomitopsis serialis TaxID=139415 RepID=UPI002008083A|nr:uncharacterized protein B0H18DRAFT_954333 [Neoantrodia serialis]KAH9927634.1 hypothetical protein B0H18DRAFT_954333 [Neoantrodia serialis]